MPLDVPDWSTQIIRPDTVPAGAPKVLTAGTTITPFTVLKGSHVVTVVVSNYSSTSFIQVIGATSNVTYLEAYPNVDGLPRPYYLLISTEIDAVINVSVTCSATITLYVASVGDVPAVAVAQAPAQPWQAPNRTPGLIAMGYPGSGVSTTVLASPGAGKSLWLHSMTLRWTAVVANCFGKWQDTAGTDMIWEPGATTLDSLFYDFKGTELAQNVGFRFLGQGSAAANASFLQGTIVYSVF
ncbi:MAG TPA: hypothetical protein VHT26_07680 [Trebonia sp.]|jgi:hypothetical protein|nr:hypothetical protein [Trebonia sp.]